MRRESNRIRPGSSCRGERMKHRPKYRELSMTSKRLIYILFIVNGCSHGEIITKIASPMALPCCYMLDTKATRGFKKEKWTQDKGQFLREDRARIILEESIIARLPKARRVANGKFIVTASIAQIVRSIARTSICEVAQCLGWTTARARIRTVLTCAPSLKAEGCGRNNQAWLGL